MFLGHITHYHQTGFVHEQRLACEAARSTSSPIIQRSNMNVIDVKIMEITENWHKFLQTPKNKHLFNQCFQFRRHFQRFWGLGPKCCKMIPFLSLSHNHDFTIFTNSRIEKFHPSPPKKKEKIVAWMLVGTVPPPKTVPTPFFVARTVSRTVAVPQVRGQFQLSRTSAKGKLTGPSTYKSNCGQVAHKKTDAN